MQAGINAKIITGTGNQIYGAMRERKFDLLVGRGGSGMEPHPHSSLRALVYNPDNSDKARLTNFQGWRTGFYDPQLNTMMTRPCWNAIRKNRWLTTRPSRHATTSWFRL
ncbi:putative dipeptide ABC transport system periplasmic binding component [Klebsiella pneumoniae]|uniref:Putative dipeptide ABC transport system periplasmic binding component n=1 Tax=Klebsiella pneumoniae TaxID=573 RepID=A0A2X3E8F9_KLEPN|nr:putative dipeptide ABC transport system periplasmic binding component [Klebsiella pneumoniae]